MHQANIACFLLGVADGFMLLFHIEELDPLEPCALRPDRMLDA